ncbi:MAG: DUF177 domain-containing protein [Bacteroidales bacterium]|nr:DUF177 domain-containing protein [Bacteroidales bacterium]
MGKFDEYNIDLKGLQTDTSEFEFQLDSLFFTHIDAPEIQKGNIQAKLKVVRQSQAFELTFHCEGYVIVQCDRCLDEMEQSITAHDKLKVKFGDKYADEGDDIVIIPESEGAINVAWFLYEFIVLAVPMKHVHPVGKCNKSMTGQLRKHLVTSDEEMSDEETSAVEDGSVEEESNGQQPIDPRWEGLKEIIDNN